jgi:coproporphyrinogen III oxidase-like Fe-S oxidoreductase
VRSYASEIEELVALGLLESQQSIVRLTARGRLLSNEVFARFLSSGGVGQARV